MRTFQGRQMGKTVIDLFSKITLTKSFLYPRYAKLLLLEKKINIVKKTTAIPCSGALEQ